MARERFTRDNDPVHYMRELEFRNTIDQYDLAVVLFFKKDVDDCKRLMPGFRYAAHKSRGKADFIAISAKAAPELVDELAVDVFPTMFSFRHGHLIEKLENSTQPKDIYYYVKNITSSKYRYVHDTEDAASAFDEHNTTLLVSMPLIDARMDRLLAVITTKFFRVCQILVSTEPSLSKSFGIEEFPSITIMRIHDDTNISFPGEAKRATVKSLSDFVEKNAKPNYELMVSLETAIATDDQFFAAIFDFSDRQQMDIVKEVMQKVVEEHKGKFPMRYGDISTLSLNITELHMENLSAPIFGFFKKENFSFRKWLFAGRPAPLAVTAFCSDHLRHRIPETIIDTPIESKSSPLYKHYSGKELATALEKQKDKDFIINFVGFPCYHCESVDQLFLESAQWAKKNSIKHVVFGRVNASSNDIPMTVWRNETYPYAWMFPANNRTGAFPAGKRRSLFWMAQLLKDNSTKPINAPLPQKPQYSGDMPYGHSNNEL